MPTKSGQVFAKARCRICGKMITINGLGAASHYRMHQREKANKKREKEKCSKEK